MRALWEGDRLVVAKLDRLARSLKDLLDLDAEIRAKGASLVLLDSNVDTATSSGRLFISIMGAAAEFEASLVSEHLGQPRSIVQGRARVWNTVQRAPDRDTRPAKLGSGQVPERDLHLFSFIQRAIYRKGWEDGGG